MSANNQVESRMTPLSKALAGLIFSQDTFGNQVDFQRRTVGVDLEKKNFKRTGDALAKVWNEQVIDNCSVTFEYVESSTINPVAYEER